MASTLKSAVPSHLKPSAALGGDAEFARKHHGKTQSHMVSWFFSVLEVVRRHGILWKEMAADQARALSEARESFCSTLLGSWKENGISTGFLENALRATKYLETIGIPHELQPSIRRTA
jgi:hypothetical protein